MLDIKYQKDFLKYISKVKNQSVNEQIKSQVEKIIMMPEVGKPMRHARKGTREIYVAPYRLAYTYNKAENRIVFLDIYHRDEQ